MALIGISNGILGLGENDLHRIAFVVITLSAVIIFSAVFINFISCSRRQAVKRERKSLVATASMTLFFVLLYELIHMRVGVLHVTDMRIRLVMAAVGLASVAAGCVVNIMGRLYLGKNWANQATIYGDQRLVTSGIYSIVRHPLYASLIWMFYGASITYGNVASFLAISFIFVPFMYHRASIEEELLKKEFKDYDEYKKRVGMFFFRPLSYLTTKGVRT